MPCHACGETGHVVETYQHSVIRVMFCLGCEKPWTLVGDGHTLRVLRQL